MLAELFEQDHREQARAGEAARRDMERRRRLADRLAPSAGEALANRLDHLPLTRHDFERFGDVLSELRQLRRTAARTALRRGDNDPLARQMVGERLARRPLALEGLDHGRGRGAFRRHLVLGRVGLGVLQLHLQLLDEPLLALRARAIERAPQLFDLKPQPCDQRFHARCGCVSVSEVRFRPRRARFALPPRSPFGEDQPMSNGEVAGERVGRVRHARERIRFVPVRQQKSLAGRARSPGFLRHSPVDALDEIAELRR